MQVQGKSPFTMQRNTFILDKQVFEGRKSENCLFFCLKPTNSAHNLRV